jgi:hypothetical protein
MGRIFLIFILLLALGFTFPRSREVILDVSEPATTAIMNPFRGWMTNQELGRIVQDLQEHERARGSLPMRPEEFQAWMDSRYRQESLRVDAWGNRYRLEVRGNEIRVMSAGPDGEFGTDRDLVREGVRGELRQRPR